MILVCDIVDYDGSLTVSVVDGAQSVVPLLARRILEYGIAKISAHHNSLGYPWLYTCRYQRVTH